MAPLRMRAKTDNAKTATKLLVAMTGKASPAKAAAGPPLGAVAQSVSAAGEPLIEVAACPCDRHKWKTSRAMSDS
jgi:hypothetical protein